MSGLFIEILNMSLSASCVALIVMLIRLVIKKVPQKYAYALWAVVFFRLVCPFTIQLPVNAVPIQTQTIPHDIVYSENPSVQSGMTVIDNAVNTVIERSLPHVSPVNSINPVHVVLEIGAYLWLGGIMVLLLYAIISYARLKKRVSTAIRVNSNIYETEFIKTPFVLGLIRPKIYIPTGLDEKELDYIIKHEQTHIKRFDYLIKPLAFIIASVHWFNPVAWISYMLMARDMELSADESVIRRSGFDIRSDYSNSLLALSVKKSGLLSPLAFGETGVKERIKNVLNYKKPTFWVSIAAVMIVVMASVLLLGGKESSTTNDDNISGLNTVEIVTSAPGDTNTILPSNILDDDNTEPSRTPAKFEWPDSDYSKVKVTLLNSSEGYNWATEFDDPAIVGYIHASLTNDLIHSEETGYDNKRFNQYQIEVYNDTGGYSCTLYHDIENSKAYVVKDGGLYEIWCEFARNIDCFLRDVNKGFGGKTVAAALFKQYGWTLGYDIIGWPDYLAETPCKLPSFGAMGSFTSNEYYFAYNNELSKDIGLDMSGYAGSEVSVRIYRLLERMPDEFYPIESCRGIVVWKDEKIIGAYISAGRHDAFFACSLNGYGFEAVTGQTVDEWLEKKIKTDETERELSQLQPEQIIERYFNALDNGDYQTAGRCMSRRTQMQQLTSNMPDNQLFNESVFLPLAGAGVGDKGSGILSYNLRSAELVSVEPINAYKFKVIVNLQYRDDLLTNNGSGEQFWECHMIYESPQTGWKIVEFGH